MEKQIIDDLMLTLKRYIYLKDKATNYWWIKSYYNSIIMEYQKIANLLNDESNKPSKFRTRNWVEINDDITGAYSPNK